jgi:hypothetical protein
MTKNSLASLSPKRRVARQDAYELVTLFEPFASLDRPRDGERFFPKIGTRLAVAEVKLIQRQEFGGRLVVDDRQGILRSGDLREELREWRFPSVPPIGLRSPPHCRRW